MKITTAIVTGAALIAVGGGLFAAQAAASPTLPTPSASAPAGGTAAGTTGARAAVGLGVGWFYRALTDTQRACLADAGLQRPEGRLTEDERTKLQEQVKSALSGCGVQVPARLADRPRLGFAWASLSTEQQHCLAAKELTRPLGRLTDAQRAAVRTSMLDAAKSCGVG